MFFRVLALRALEEQKQTLRQALRRAVLCAGQPAGWPALRRLISVNYGNCVTAF